MNNSSFNAVYPSNHLNFQQAWSSLDVEQQTCFGDLAPDVLEALWSWLAGVRAQHLSQFAAGSAQRYTEVVERSNYLAHHLCIVRIREYLQQVVDRFKSEIDQRDEQMERVAHFQSKMREIDALLKRCLAQEHELKQLIEINQSLREILKANQKDLTHHQAALSMRLPIWRAEVMDNNPLNDDVVRNDTAERRLQSVVALIQSSQTSEMQLSLMYNQMSWLYENLTTIRQVTYPIWQQKAVNQTIIYDQEFLNTLQQTLSHTGEIAS